MTNTKDADGQPFAPLTGSALWERAKHNDATVAKGLRAGEGLETIIGYLAAEKEWMMKRLIALESITPRKITLPDGRVMVWHFPDDLIPEAPNRKSAKVTFAKQDERSRRIFAYSGSLRVKCGRNLKA